MRYHNYREEVNMMMSTLGTAILVAMRDQGWTVLFNEEVDALAVLAPRGSVRVIPKPLLDEGEEQRLRIILLALIVVDGLQWPWPPDHDDEVHGEQPRLDW